jgi:hypothetical protein
MNRNGEEYVVLNIETYDRLKGKSEILNKIEKNIESTSYDEDGTVLSGLWFATTAKVEKKLEVDLEEILNILGYDIAGSDSIIVKNPSNKS